MVEKLKNYLFDESGQTSTEYILLIVVAAMIVIKFKDAIEKKLIGDSGVLGTVMSKITEEVNNLQ